VLLLLGCEQPHSDVAPPPTLEDAGSASATRVSPQFVDVNFLTAYQTLMLHGMTQQEKAEIWSRFYEGHWIRWSGELAYVKKDALLFRELNSTATYDVFLRIAHVSDERLRSFSVGRFYNYMGRLYRYEDGFRTIFADQGVVLDAGPDGVPGVLAMEPPEVRHITPPPVSSTPNP